MKHLVALFIYALSVASLLAEPYSADANRYLATVSALIRANWKITEEMRGRTTVIRFGIGPNGELSAPALILSSGMEEFDRAAMVALRRSTPFPSPPNDTLETFKEIRLKFDDAFGVAPLSSQWAPSSTGLSSLLYLVPIVLGVLLVSASVKVVQPFHAAVQIRLGRIVKVLSAGAHWVMPVLDRVLLVDLRDQNLHLTEFQLSDKNGHQFSLSAKLTFRVVDPLKATIKVADIAHAVQLLTEEQLKSAARERAMDEIGGSLRNIQDQLSRNVRTILDTWGLVLQNLALEDFRR